MSENVGESQVGVLKLIRTISSNIFRKSALWHLVSCRRVILSKSEKLETGTLMVENQIVHLYGGGGS